MMAEVLGLAGALFGFGFGVSFGWFFGVFLVCVLFWEFSMYVDWNVLMTNYSKY